jgi:hypothetical protein
MRQSLHHRSVVILVVTTVVIFGLAASPPGWSGIVEKFRKMFVPENIYARDRQFILQVPVHLAVKAEADRVMAGLRASMNRRGMHFESVERTDPATPAEAGDLRIIVKGIAAQDAEAFRDLVRRSFSLREVSENSSADFFLQFQPSRISSLRLRAVEQSLDALQRRLKAEGLRNITIRVYGPADSLSQILVQVPENQDIDRVRTAIALPASEISTNIFEAFCSEKFGFSGDPQGFNDINFRFGNLPLISELSRTDGVHRGVQARMVRCFIRPSRFEGTGVRARRGDKKGFQVASVNAPTGQSEKCLEFSKFQRLRTFECAMVRNTVREVGDRDGRNSMRIGKRISVAHGIPGVSDAAAAFADHMKFSYQEGSVMIPRKGSFPDTINKSVSWTLCRKNLASDRTDGHFAATAS